MIDASRTSMTTLGGILSVLMLCPPLGASTKSGSCHAILHQFPIVIAEFARQYGRLPTEQEGLEILVCQPSDWSSEKSWKPLMKHLPTDPWGSDYRYILTPGRKPGFGVYSLGADQTTHSDGNDPDDLNTWNPKAPWLAYYKARSSPMRFWPFLIPPFVIGIAWLSLSRHKCPRQ